VTSVTAGLNYEYDVQASDADNDALTYALSGAPSWLSIDPNGRITGSPGVAQIGRLRRQPDTHRGRPTVAAASARRNPD
jgi:putative Ig domain-containing protein